LTLQGTLLQHVFTGLTPVLLTLIQNYPHHHHSTKSPSIPMVVPPQVALLQHVFTRVVPVPQPWRPDCFYHAPMRYALQLDVLVLLRRITV
jgi:hypothetical protein